MNLILIPVFNDWRSLNKLLFKINENSNTKNLTSILVIDDCSSLKPSINKKKFKNIKRIEILKLNQNVGSQKAIAVGLNYLNTKKHNYKFLTVMDGDGEDNPSEIKNMITLAKKNKNSVIVSCRLDRKENFIIKFCYKIHLFITLALTGNWISFGNFSCFYHHNLKKILKDDSVWLAYSAAVKKNTNILRTYAIRSKRYYDKTRVNFSFLLGHSIKIMSVFYRRIITLSFVILFLSNYYDFNYLLFLNLLIILINLLIILYRFKNVTKNHFNHSLKKIK